jgi:hypothetical protein
LDEDLYPNQDWPEPAQGNNAEVAVLADALADLVTRDADFNTLIDAALDWLDGEGPSSDMQEPFLDFADALLERDLPGELLQRHLQLFQRSLKNQDRVELCLSLLQFGAILEPVELAALDYEEAR